VTGIDDPVTGRMKIFFWSEVSTLLHHTEGMVVAFARDREEAVRIAVAEYGPDEAHPYRTSHTNCAALERELRSTEPQIFGGPRAFVISGSD
jgi:hypothetical protein